MIYKYLFSSIIIIWSVRLFPDKSEDKLETPINYLTDECSNNCDNENFESTLFAHQLNSNRTLKDDNKNNQYGF